MVECFEGYLAYLIIVDKCSRYVWVFLRKLKEPPVNLIKAFLAIHRSHQVGGAIRTDQVGELARSTSFRTDVYKATKYAIEPTGADSASQNRGAKKWNHTLTVMTWTLLYGAGLPARYWSAVCGAPTCCILAQQTSSCYNEYDTIQGLVWQMA